MIASEIERSEIGDECRFVLEATQIEDVRAIFDPPDYRNRKIAHRCCEPFKCATGTRRARPDRQPSTWHSFHRQCTRTDLARACYDIDSKTAAELRRDDRQ